MFGCEKIHKFLCFTDCPCVNTEFPYDPTAINEIPGVRPQDTEAHPLITREEIDKALKSMKYRKAPGIDAITAEVLRVAGEPMIQMFEKLFNAIWQEEQTPRDWSRMLVTPIHKKETEKTQQTTELYHSYLSQQSLQ